MSITIRAVCPLLSGLYSPLYSCLTAGQVYSTCMLTAIIVTIITITAIITVITVIAVIIFITVITAITTIIIIIIIYRCYYSFNL